jgi:hypothetical protein
MGVVGLVVRKVHIFGCCLQEFMKRLRGVITVSAAVMGGGWVGYCFSSYIYKSGMQLVWWGELGGRCRLFCSSVRVVRTFSILFCFFY